MYVLSLIHILLDIPTYGAINMHGSLLPHKHAADGFFIWKLRKHA